MPLLQRIFIGLCLLAALALSIGLQLIERVWPGVADAKLLYSLNLLRGLPLVSFTAALITILLLYRGRLRLPAVSLRTKILVPLVVLVAAPTITIGVSALAQIQDSLWQGEFQRIEFDTAAKARAVEEFLNDAQQDLIFLSQVKAVRELAATNSNIDPLRAEVEREFLIFARGRRAYYRIRYFSDAGAELVRVDVESGQPASIAPDQLSNSIEKSSLKAALALEPGQVFIAPPALDLEAGSDRGIIRYATPVVAGERRALLSIDIYTDYLFSLIYPLSPNMEAWLVDRDGNYFGYLGASADRRARYSLKSRRNIAADYQAPEIAGIMGRERERRVIKGDTQMLASAPIAFDAGASAQSWILIVAHPRAPLEAPLRALTIPFFAVMSVYVVLLVAIAGGIGYIMADYLTRPVESLRRATQEIAAGNLTKRVELSTGDEIESLAQDFNVMTERLREAREQLSAWNAELSREVARQTEHLRHLQTGIARTDKLATIGQMTAGIMHEIGNPLAAIKTKIQVAEEEGEPDTRLLAEILDEVNRLALFLRSFSRLARLNESQFGDVRVAQAVEGVMTLVKPELERRGIELKVESAADDAAIRGDANQLRQLLINLILNAADASPRGSAILIKISSGREGVCIEVIDHGAGMTAEVIEKIWYPFFTTKPEGTGLGLAICRQIVQDHNGKIEVKSEPGRGTTVAMTFNHRGTENRESAQ